MGKERILEVTKTKKLRTSGFIHVGEIIPRVVRDIERKIKESHKNKKGNLRPEAEKKTS